MEKKTINLTAPHGWHELSDNQLRFVYTHIAADATLDELKILCLLQWNKVKVEGRQPNGAYILRRGKDMADTISNALTKDLSRKFAV